MAELKDKIKMALDETRILVYGVQILLGFEYNSVFQKGFDTLPDSSHAIKLVSMSLILVSLAFIMAPATYHQIVSSGEDSRDSLRHITVFAGIALFPFALGLGGDVYVVVEKVTGPAVAFAGASLAVLFALFFWYGLELLNRRRKTGENEERRAAMDDNGVGKEKDDQENEQSEQKKLEDKLNFLLTEARVVIPGAQALLGFQFISMLAEQFDKLPTSMKYLHLASLAAVAISTILLMSPAAYHRISERGEITRRLYKFADRMLMIAMVFLALGLSGDFYVVVYRTTASYLFSLACAVAMLLFFYGLWFGYSFFRRSRNREEDASSIGQRQVVSEGRSRS